MVFEALCPNYDFSDETIQKIVGIFETNAIEIRMAMMSDVMALYETACLLEHNCVPNLHITFDKKFNVSLRICRTPTILPYKSLYERNTYNISLFLPRLQYVLEEI